MIDVISSAEKHRRHLRPVYDALPDDLRGRWRERGERGKPKRQDIALVAGYLDMREARRRDYRRIALLEHGIGQSYGDESASYPGGKDRGPVGLFLSPNETAAERDRKAYPAARVEVVGSPILDTLPRKKRSDPPTLAVTFHWHYTRIPELRSAFEHFRPALADLAAAHRLVGHAHPQAVGMVLPTYRELGIEYEPDYFAVLRRADLLIADNTSALYEFASTGRPVVVLNDPQYRRLHELGLRFWRAAHVGVNVDEPEQLLDAVAFALADPPGQRQLRADALRVAYAYKTGAGKRAAKVLVDWHG